ncbi:MAG TPA: hypothetical protein PK559_12825 [Ignavibacteriaceae bacterium]|nr:hypothetical protein [Ignavibacteriaceae bacterium]
MSAEYNCQKIFATGTNAFRIAKNATYVREKVKNETGVIINIISGEEEAELSFLGVASFCKGEQNIGIIDIGGGSTEIAFRSSNGDIIKFSLQIGVVSLKECSDKSVLLAKAQIKIDNCIQMLPRDNFSNIEIFALAGTPTALSAIKHNISDYSNLLIDEDILTIDEIAGFVKLLSVTPTDEILKEFGSVVSKREDLLLFGALILYNIMKYYNIAKVIVSNKGLRYGTLIKYYFMTSDTCSE